MPGHSNTGGGTQNQNNILGDRACVRQSRLFREYESGNAVKGLLGSSHLQWKTDRQEGAYSGHAVFDDRIARYSSDCATTGAAPRQEHQQGRGSGHARLALPAAAAPAQHAVPTRRSVGAAAQRERLVDDFLSGTPQPRQHGAPADMESMLALARRVAAADASAAQAAAAPRQGGGRAAAARPSPGPARRAHPGRGASTRPW